MDAFKILKTLHLSLLIGVSLFIVVVLFMIKKIEPVGESVNRILQVVVVVASLISLFVGFNLFRRKMMAARNHTGTAIQRMDKYRSASILWWSMIEIPAMFAAIGYLLTGNKAFLFMALFHVLLLLVFMPRKDNIIQLLNLNSDEVAELENSTIR